MDEKLQRKLIKKYPFMKRKKLTKDNTEMHTTYDIYGVECDNGWYDLIDDLLSRIGPVNVHQIKQKFGMLRFYCDSDSKEMSNIYDLIHEAEAKSATICEQCGKPGKLRERRGWYRTICDECGVIKEL